MENLLCQKFRDHLVARAIHMASHPERIKGRLVLFQFFKFAVQVNRLQPLVRGALARLGRLMKMHIEARQDKASERYSQTMETLRLNKGKMMEVSYDRAEDNKEHSLADFRFADGIREAMDIAINKSRGYVMRSGASAPSANLKADNYALALIQPTQQGCYRSGPQSELSDSVSPLMT